ncbi:MAG: hypothetical protein KJ896_01940 [Nanoarchaeota archaeon]|nr:hypothetical protein [Nanoarchaeota archaeon]
MILFVFGLSGCNPQVPTGEVVKEPVIDEVDSNEQIDLEQEADENLIEIIQTEEDLIKLDIEVFDPDGDELTFKYSEPFDENGEWQTKLGDAGTYDAHVIVSDGKSMTKVEFVVVVELKNTAPRITFIEDIEVDEGEVITIPVDAVDREGDILAITISGWFDTTSYITTYADEGEHKITVTVSDGELKTSQEVSIFVNDVNRPPVFKIPA